MKRIIVRAITTNIVLQTIFVEDKYTKDMCNTISRNPEYGGVKIDYYFEIESMTEEQIRAWHYLNSTDWYAIRKADTGQIIPQDVIDARQTARELL